MVQHSVYSSIRLDLLLLEGKQMVPLNCFVKWTHKFLTGLF